MTRSTKTKERPERRPSRLEEAEARLVEVEAHRQALEERLAQLGPLEAVPGAHRQPFVQRPPEARGIAIELRQVEDEAGTLAAEVQALRRLARAPERSEVEAMESITAAVAKENEIGRQAAAAKTELVQATKVGDVDRVMAAQHRLDVMPVLARAATLERLRAEAALARRQEEGIAVVLAMAAEELARAQQADAQAAQEAQAARSRLLECHEEVKRLQLEPRRLRKRVNELMAQVDALAEGSG